MSSSPANLSGLTAPTPPTPHDLSPRAFPPGHFPQGLHGRNGRQQQRVGAITTGRNARQWCPVVPSGDPQRSAPARLTAGAAAAHCPARSGGPKAVESAALEAASSRTRGSGWAPSGPASSWEYRAAQSRQARPEEAREPSWDAAKGALWRSCATSEAATLCGGGCNPMWRRVQHYVAGAATLFGRAARRWSPRGRAG